MTFYYRTTTFGSQEPTSEMKAAWERASQKKNWRIVRLPNGYYQTEFLIDDETWKDVTRRETVEGAEAAIDSSIEHYAKKLEFAKGPVVVKTFE
jgi:hypothetical protein